MDFCSLPRDILFAVAPYPDLSNLWAIVLTSRFLHAFYVPALVEDLDLTGSECAPSPASCHSMERRPELAACVRKLFIRHWSNADGESLAPFGAIVTLMTNITHVLIKSPEKLFRDEPRIMTDLMSFKGLMTVDIFSGATAVLHGERVRAWLQGLSSSLRSISISRWWDFFEETNPLFSLLDQYHHSLQSMNLEDVTIRTNAQIANVSWPLVTALKLRSFLVPPSVLSVAFPNVRKVTATGPYPLVNKRNLDELDRGWGNLENLTVGILRGTAIHLPIRES